MLNNGDYDGKLAKEHEEFTQEIYGMIKTEYSEWESDERKLINSSLKFHI